MNKELIVLFLTLFFAYSQFFTPIIPLWVVYGIILLIPIIRLVVKEDYHIFAFDITDTMQSITLNSIFSVGLIIVLLIIGIITNRTSIIAYSSPGTIELFFGLLISFFQELFFRYYLQETIGVLLKNTNNSVLLTSIISSSFFIPKWEIIIAFFIMGLFFGWIYSKTKDIYGITLGHFILSLFLDFTI